MFISFVYIIIFYLHKKKRNDIIIFLIEHKPSNPLSENKRPQEK